MSRTLRTTIGLAVAATTAVGLVGAGSGAAVTATHTRAAVAPTPKLTVTMHKHYTVKGPKTFAPGRVSLVAKAVGAEREVDVVSFKKGYTFKHFAKDVGTFGASDGPNGPSKAGLKALNRAVDHTTAYGGLDVDKGATEHGSIVLPKAGTYFLFNDTELPAQPVKLHVVGPKVKRASPHASATITAHSGFRFGGARTLPKKGTVTFKNTSKGETKSPHFLVLVHVKNGTTKKQVEQGLQSNGPPSFIRNGDFSTDLMSPNQSMTISYRLPKGEYAELCFFPDLQTGMPHAFMGMIRIVHLK
jgi:hypothetical protein